MRTTTLILVSSLSLAGAAAVAACSSEDPNVLNGQDPSAEDGLRGSRACKGNPHKCDAGSPDAAPPSMDAGTADAAPPPPPPPPMDAGSSDAAPPPPMDAGTKDAAPPPTDAGTPPPADAGTPPPADAGSTTVSFSKQVQPIFTTSCALSSCHGGVFPPNLTAGGSYAAIVNVSGVLCSTAKYVVAGQPQQSWLLQKMTTGGAVGTCTGGSMAGYSNDANRTIIRTWIQEGAANN